MEHIIPKASDTLSLQAILSAPITTTLPLMDFLKVKPELWAQVSKLLRDKGYFGSGHFNYEQQKISALESQAQKVSLNKLNNSGKYKVDKGKITSLSLIQAFKLIDRMYEVKIGFFPIFALLVKTCKTYQSAM